MVGRRETADAEIQNGECRKCRDGQTKNEQFSQRRSAHHSFSFKRRAEATMDLSDLLKCRLCFEDYDYDVAQFSTDEEKRSSRLPVLSHQCPHKICCSCLNKMQLVKISELTSRKARTPKWFECPFCKNKTAFNATDIKVDIYACGAVASLKAATQSAGPGGETAEDPIQQEAVFDEDEDMNDEDTALEAEDEGMNDEDTALEAEFISRRKIHETLKDFYFSGKVGTGNSNHAPFCKLGDNSPEESFRNATLVFLDPNSWDIGAPSEPRSDGYMRYRTSKPTQYRHRCFNEKRNVWRKLIVFRKVETKKARYQYLGNYRFELDGKGTPKIDETMTIPHAADSPRGKAILRSLKGDSCVEDALGWFTNLENWRRTPLRFVSYDHEFARRLTSKEIMSREQPHARNHN